VIEVMPGVVDSSGLLRVELSAGRVRLPRVRAWFGGNVWVIRSLTLSELVSAWDVPEKLGKLIGSDEGRMDLMKKPFTPLKIRQTVLEEVKSVYSYLTEDDGSSLDLGLGRKLAVEESNSARRGLSLKLTTPEEEREIFCDKFDTPRNELIWPLSKEERAISKATKDDKAPIKTEVWDTFLYLGLPLEVQTRCWAEAARTIRPLIARHWRRLQLRKWIRFVKEKRARLETISEHDRDAARECLLRLQATTFWEWKSGHVLELPEGSTTHDERWDYLVDERQDGPLVAVSTTSEGS
jgi:hypothetical protein